MNRKLKLLSEESQIPWQKILRRIMSNSKNFFEPSYKKVNRRFFKRIDLPGKKVFYIPTLICIIDVSGSMTNKEILKGIIEIKKICKSIDIKAIFLQVYNRLEYTSFTISLFRRIATNISFGFAFQVSSS